MKTPTEISSKARREELLRKPLQLPPHPFTAIALTMALVIGPLVSRPDASTAITPSGSRKVAPDFALSDSKGASVKLSDFRGKVLLLDVWATWCTGCKVEIPWYMQFQKKYAKRGLTAIGVAMDEEGWQKVTPYLQRHPINYPIVVADADFSRQYNVTAMPVTLLIDREGRVADWHIGMVVRSVWEKEIQILLQEK